MLSEGTGYQSTQKIGSEEIGYYDRGQGSPMVLLHGMFGDFLDWEPVLEPLAASHRVIAVDLPGFGRSSKPRGEYSAEFFVSALHEFFEQLKLSEFILAGNSFGGQLAILYALRHPDSVSKLVLVNSGGFRRYTSEEMAVLEPRFNEAALAALTPEINALLFSGVFTKTSETSMRYLEKQNNKLRRADYPAYAVIVFGGSASGVAVPNSSGVGRTGSGFAAKPGRAGVDSPSKRRVENHSRLRPCAAAGMSSGVFEEHPSVPVFAFIFLTFVTLIRTAT
jgi:pimeloyl-ACP methyl ester carboxylesterase